MQTLSFQAPEEMNKALEKYAKKLDRSKGYLLRQALAEFLEDLEDVVRVKRARAKNGSKPTISFEEVKRQLNLP